MKYILRMANSKNSLKNSSTVDHQTKEICTKINQLSSNKKNHHSNDDKIDKIDKNDKNEKNEKNEKK